MDRSKQDKNIQNVGMDKIDQVTAVLADAFKKDPIITWISNKPGYPEYAFAGGLPMFLPHGQTYVAGDGLGAASWLPPGVQADLRVTLKTLWEAVTGFGLGSIRRLYAISSLMTKNHPKPEHYYLFALGVRSEMQGKGIGSDLIQHVLARCDREHVPAYLENSNNRNLSFYERHGFKVMRELKTPGNGAKMWAMWREPAGHHTG